MPASPHRKNFQRYARRIDTADLMNKPAVGEPHDGGLVFFARPPSRTRPYMNFFVFFGKLGGMLFQIMRIFGTIS